MVAAVFIDMSRAFDTISRSQLITKLELYSTNGIELEWFSDFNVLTFTTCETKIIYETLALNFMKMLRILHSSFYFVKVNRLSWLYHFPC